MAKKSNFEQLPFHYKQELTGAVTGDWVIFPLFDDKGNKLTRLLYTLSPTGGQGRVEVTTDSEEDVKAGIAIPTNWPQGNVTVLTQDDSVPVTAFRLVCVSGTVRLSVRGV